jgi:ABC-type polysaccharide/polyol phosphate export permease
VSASATPVIISSPPAQPEWRGDYLFLIKNLIAKDFKIRYRNMSLGVFWSLLNPLVMMGVLWFIFTRVFPNNTIPHFAVFALCGLIPYNFFSIGWVTGTTSLIDNAHLIKRVRVPRELIPIATVLANCVQMGAQILLLIVMVLASGYKVNWQWFWLIYVWGFLVVFTTGLALIFSALNVYIRDIRYVVESGNLVLFWLVPIFYPFTLIAPMYREIYRLNPIAAVVLASRNVLLDGIAPPPTLLWKLPLVSIAVLVLGLAFFRKLQAGFYNHL